MERLQQGPRHLVFWTCSSICLSLNMIFGFMQIFEHAFSEHNTPFFRNVPLITECSSLRNVFSHLVKRDIMGGIHCCTLYLELSLNNT